MPRINYKNEAGTRLPGTTTVGGAFKPSIEGLMYWANKGGQEGKSLDELRDSATTAGTAAHALIDAHLHGKDLGEVEKDYPQEAIDAAQNAFLNFLEWAEHNELKPIAIEPNLVSEIYQYGGLQT